MNLKCQISVVSNGVFDSHFFPFLGPAADKTCFPSLEQLKMEHKIRHHSSVVGFYAVMALTEV